MIDVCQFRFLFIGSDLGGRKVGYRGVEDEKAAKRGYEIDPKRNYRNL